MVGKAIIALIGFVMLANFASGIVTTSLDLNNLLYGVLIIGGGLVIGFWILGNE